MTDKWLWRSNFSQRLETVELGYGPITAPSVRATGAASYLCLFQVPQPKKAVTRTHPASAVSQDLGPTRYTPPCTNTHTKTDYLQRRQNLPIGARQHWQVLWEGPIEIEVILPLSLSLSRLLTPPSKPPQSQFQGPMWMKKSCDQTPPGRQTRQKEGTYLEVVHLPRNTSKDKEHTYTVCWMLVCATL